ncbi:LAGLIDADG family homing endonuclease [Candidatus Nomurabacteria bacterium]|nr:LAGLIDADG family homing endonuclease [Candidatus Nomurabacteria bacterium]
MRKKDHTLNEIVQITGRSKTTVYFHIRNIPLSKQKRKKISEATRWRALRVAAARKGKALRPFKPFQSWTPELVLLVSHLMFDGEITKSKCRYHNRSAALIKRVEDLMQLVYDYKGTKNTDTTSGVVTVSFHNVELETFLKSKSKELLKNIHVFSRSKQTEFLRAFFDDEGCMDVRLNKSLRRIRGYQNDQEILKLVKLLLKNFDIESKLRKPNEVVISGKENLRKFQKEINFSKGVRLNPNRTNSIWKKDIEKRELLDIAIRSYQI